MPTPCGISLLLTLSTAWLLRCKQYLKKLLKGEDSFPVVEQWIDVSKLQRADSVLVNYAKKQEFTEWFSKLSGKIVGKKLLRSTVLYHLNRALFDNVFRVGGRLANANLSFEAKFPAILHQKSHLTSLIIQDC